MTSEELLAHVLCTLAAETNAKSPSGLQLDRLSVAPEVTKERHHWGVHSAPSRGGKGKDYEAALLASAEVFGIIRGLSLIRDTSIECEQLRALSAAIDKALGATCVRVLRTYQSALRAPTEEELESTKGLVNPGAKLRRLREKWGVDALVRQFRLTDKVAAEVYADAVLVLDQFIRHQRRAKRS